MRRAIRACERIGTVGTVLVGLGMISLLVGGWVLIGAFVVPGASLLGAGAVLLAAGIRLAWLADIKLGELEAMREIGDLNERTLKILETTFTPPKKKKRRRTRALDYSDDVKDEPFDECEPEQNTSDAQDSDVSVASDEEDRSSSCPSEEDAADDYDAFLEECEREEQEQLNHKKKTHG